MFDSHVAGSWVFSRCLGPHQTSDQRSFTQQLILACDMATRVDKLFALVSSGEGLIGFIGLTWKAPPRNDQSSLHLIGPWTERGDWVQASLHDFPSHPLSLLAF